MSSKISTKGATRAKRAIVAAAVLGLAIGAGRTAQAADFCFTGGLFAFAGKGFKVPSKGRCKPFTGWKSYVITDDSYLVTGTACTPVNGDDFVDLNLVSQRSGGVDTHFESIRLPLHAGTPGFYKAQWLNGSTMNGTIALPGAPCVSAYYP